jgi:NAD(P)H-flavin reductase
MLHVPVPGSKPALRAYSIASSDQRHDGFRLIFKYVENGVASNYVWSLKGGETLDFTGPFGRIFFREPPTPQLVFLNTGSGVSQHISFIESNVEKYPDLRYRLLFGVRSEVDIYYAEELARLKRKLRDFEYEFVLSRPSPEWTGKKGYVQDFIANFDYQQIPTTFYLCGNTGMINATKAALLTKNFDSSLILSEAFD